jgi:hypothetical protein
LKPFYIFTFSNSQCHDFYWRRADKGHHCRFPLMFLSVADIHPLLMTQVWILAYIGLTQFTNESLKPKRIKVLHMWLVPVLFQKKIGKK